MHLIRGKTTASKNVTLIKDQCEWNERGGLAGKRDGEVSSVGGPPQAQRLVVGHLTQMLRP